jgi:lipoprotein-anchoring transpeptidase ErfK/SrfK
MHSPRGVTAIAGLRSAAPRLDLPHALVPSRRIGVRTAAALVATCLLGFTARPAVAAPTPARVQSTQELVVLLSAHQAYRSPDVLSPRMALVAMRRPITGAPTTLPVLARFIGAHRMRWLRVMLPGRPNGSTGWIAQRGTSPLVTPWRIGVDLKARLVIVYRDGSIAREFRAVIGKPSTPTPTGVFFVEESVRMPAGQSGGPYALALSARSNVLQEFEGGPGQVAIHGSVNLDAPLGTAASFGCIRLANASVDWLSTRIGPGTPVMIYRS